MPGAEDPGEASGWEGGMGRGLAFAGGWLGSMEGQHNHHSVDSHTTVPGWLPLTPHSEWSGEAWMGILQDPQSSQELQILCIID